MANTKKFPVIRVTEHDRIKVDSLIVREFSLSIILNGRKLVILSCSPMDFEYLAVGFIQSQGLIDSKDDIKSLEIDKPNVVHIETRKSVDITESLVLTSSGGRSGDLLNIKNIINESHITITADRVFSLMEQFEHRSRDFKATGGVHSAALCDMENMLIFSEDIGRHNAVDKVFGRCLMQDIPTDNRFIITSGRVSSDIILKIARRNIPVLIARNSPTDLGIELASDLGITLLGFVRGTNMNIYTNEWRIVH
jgi:FdhD protein